MPKIISSLAGIALLTGLLAVAAPASAVPSGPSDPGAYAPAHAVRVLDTRVGLGAPKRQVAAGATVTFSGTGTVQTIGGVPNADMLDVSVPTRVAAGSLSVYPGGTAWNGRVSMTLVGGNIQQVLTVRPGTDGTVTIRNNAAAPVDIVVSLVAYYLGGTVIDPGMFSPIDARLVDTRGGIGTTKAPIPAHSHIVVSFWGRGGIPSGASAMVANLAVLNAKSSGNIEITASDLKQATTPIRFVGGVGTQTERTLRLGGSGKLNIFNTSGSPVDVVLDIAGFFRAGSGDNGSFVPIVPVANSIRPFPLVPGQATAVSAFGPDQGQGFAGVTILIEPTDPAGPTALSVRNSSTPFNGSPDISASAVKGLSEYTVDTQPNNQFDVQQLGGTQPSFQAWTTGWYRAPAA